VLPLMRLKQGIVLIGALDLVSLIRGGPGRPRRREPAADVTGDPFQVGSTVFLPASFLAVLVSSEARPGALLTLSDSTVRARERRVEHVHLGPEAANPAAAPRQVAQGV
jgi:hypothetical protein